MQTLATRINGSGQLRTLKGAQKRATRLKAYRLLYMGQVIGIGGQATAFDIQYNSLSKAEETIVSAVSFYASKIRGTYIQIFIKMKVN